MGDEAIHAAHCSVYRCVYGDPQCPVVEEILPGGRAELALASLREPVDTIVPPAEEYRVRDKASGWVYALPKALPKFLERKRDTLECAEWHLRQLNAGNEPEDWGWVEIVKRPVGQWEVVG